MGSSIDAWDGYLRQVGEECRAGVADPTGDKPIWASLGDSEYLWSVLSGAQKEGLGLSVSIKALRHELRLSKQLLRDRSKIKTVVWMRVLVMAIAVFLLRIYGISFVLGHEDKSLPMLYGAEDGWATLLGGLWILGWTAIFLSFLPSTWLWESGFRPSAREWLKTHLDGTAASDVPWSQRTQEIAERSFALGIPMMAEIRGFLEDWAAEEHAKVRIRLSYLEELLPLWDLGVLGFGSFCCMIIPLMKGLFVGGFRIEGW